MEIQRIRHKSSKKRSLGGARRKKFINCVEGLNTVGVESGETGSGDSWEKFTREDKKQHWFRKGGLEEARGKHDRAKETRNTRFIELELQKKRKKVKGKKPPIRGPEDAIEDQKGASKRKWFNVEGRKKDAKFPKSMWKEGEKEAVRKGAWENEQGNEGGAAGNVLAKGKKRALGKRVVRLGKNTPN